MCIISAAERNTQGQNIPEKKNSKFVYTPYFKRQDRNYKEVNLSKGEERLCDFLK